MVCSFLLLYISSGSAKHIDNSNDGMNAYKGAVPSHGTKLV